MEHVAASAIFIIESKKASNAVDVALFTKTRQQLVQVLCFKRDRGQQRFSYLNEAWSFKPLETKSSHNGELPYLAYRIVFRQEIIQRCDTHNKEIRQQRSTTL